MYHLVYRQDWLSGSYVSYIRNEAHWFCKTSCTFWRYRVFQIANVIVLMLGFCLGASYVITMADYKQLQNCQVYQDN